MSSRVLTYSLDIPHPYLMEIGRTQELQGPVRYGSTGALIAPTVSGSSITITRPAGTELVSAAGITVSGSVATYSLSTLSSSEEAAEGWLVEWDLVIGGLVYPFRSAAIAVLHLLFPVVSEADIYVEEPELRYRVPQAQQTAGSGWQPQGDQTWWDIQRYLLRKGRRPWLTTEPDAFREAHRYGWLERACRGVEQDVSGAWLTKAKHYGSLARSALADIQLTYQDNDTSPTSRRGRGPIRLAPVGRPAC